LALVAQLLLPVDSVLQHQLHQQHLVDLVRLQQLADLVQQLQLNQQHQLLVVVSALVAPLHQLLPLLLPPVPFPLAVLLLLLLQQLQCQQLALGYLELLLLHQLKQHQHLSVVEALVRVLQQLLLAIQVLLLHKHRLLSLPFLTLKASFRTCRCCPKLELYRKQHPAIQASVTVQRLLTLVKNCCNFFKRKQRSPTLLHLY
jgi:hypothetical protein